ncbi:CBS domain-containing protein [Nocardia amamiensis]|uniref:CBS domain-containing protein n=1 Tax=Nocardia amamiensis TaxID=404578 RepID=UPI000A0198F2|nr:CBS domain-containing protein [Nocardia amamiensis]
MVAPDTTVVEVAEVMTRLHAPVVGVIEEHPGRRELHGVITARQLLQRLIAATESA